MCPRSANCGIKDVVNGPISYTPDGSALIGPAWGLPNVWLNEGHSFGITAAGGAGWQLAEWIVEGEPGIDMLALDPRRFGPYAGKRYLVQKNEETYRNVFTIHYPDEERPDARPAKTSPVYDRLKHLGAVFGQRYGWERANWFAPPGVEAEGRIQLPPHELVRTRRQRMPAACASASASSTSRPSPSMVSRDPGAEAWLDGLVANRVPAKIGRIALSHALTKRGGIRSEFTITKLAEERFYVVSAGAAERYDTDLLHKRLPADGSVRLANITTSRGCFVRRRPALARRPREAHRHAARQRVLPLAHGPGRGSRPRAGRVRCCASISSASLGWELHFPIEYARHLFVAIFTAGAEHGIGMAGMRAMESLRMEKSYRMWGSDLTRENTPFEAGLDRFVRMKKGDFAGRSALERQLAAGRAEPLRHARGARRHRRRSARQRADLRRQGHDGRPGDFRLLRARAGEEPRDRLREVRVRGAWHAARDPDPRRATGRDGARGLSVRSREQGPEVLSPRTA